MNLLQTTDPQKGTYGHWFLTCPFKHFEWVTLKYPEGTSLNNKTKQALGVTDTESKSGYNSNFGSPTIDRTKDFLQATVDISPIKGEPSRQEKLSYPPSTTKGKSKMNEVGGPSVNRQIEEMDVDTPSMFLSEVSSHLQSVCDTTQAFQKTKQKLIDLTGFFADRPFYQDAYRAENEQMTDFFLTIQTMVKPNRMDQVEQSQTSQASDVPLQVDQELDSDSNTDQANSCKSRTKQTNQANSSKSRTKQTNQANRRLGPYRFRKRK